LGGETKTGGSPLFYGGKEGFYVPLGETNGGKKKGQARESKKKSHFLGGEGPHAEKKLLWGGGMFAGVEARGRGSGKSLSKLPVKNRGGKSSKKEKWNQAKKNFRLN